MDRDSRHVHRPQADHARPFETKVHHILRELSNIRAPKVSTKSRNARESKWGPA